MPLGWGWDDATSLHQNCVLDPGRIARLDRGFVFVYVFAAVACAGGFAIALVLLVLPALVVSAGPRL
jgi:hypothetical protein